MPLSTAEDLAKAQDELLHLGPKAVNHPKVMLSYLRLLRELAVLNVEGVLEYGSALISRFPRHMGQDEYWQLHEEVAIAASSCGRHTVAEKLINVLEKKFPGSNRVLCLKGMALEAAGDFGAAEKLYDDALESKATYADAMKRKIGLHVTRGDLPQAISTASEYLETFQTDAITWDQLHRLYLQAGQFPQAQYCLEECLLNNPGSATVMINLADVMYAQGGLTNLKSAFAYYARVIELTGGENARALYGASAARAAMTSVVAEGSSQPGDLPELAQQQLVALYKRDAPAKVPLVQGLVDSQAA